MRLRKLHQASTHITLIFELHRLGIRRCTRSYTNSNTLYQLGPSSITTKSVGRITQEILNTIAILAKAQNNEASEINNANVVYPQHHRRSWIEDTINAIRFAMLRTPKQHIYHTSRECA